MRNLAFIVILLFCSCGLVSAQQKATPRPKIYRTWIHPRNGQAPMYGILYEVRDSSLIITPERSRINLTEGRIMTARIDFPWIEQVKIRKVNSEKNGLIIGSAIGFISVLALMPEKQTGYPMIFTALIFGLPAGAITGSVGALIGSLGVRIPINGNFENYSNNRSKLQNYAFLKKYSYGKIDHSSFIGISLGPSFPLGDFGSSSALNSHAGYAKNGYTGNVVNIGYNFKNRFGISVIGFDSQYDVKEGGAGQWWDVSGLMAGPMYSVPLNDDLYFDIKPVAGFGGAALNVNDTEQDQKQGLAADLSISLRYNFAIRWCLVADAGLFYYRQKEYISGTNNLMNLNLGAGIVYRFH